MESDTTAISDPLNEVSFILRSLDTLQKGLVGKRPEDAASILSLALGIAVADAKGYVETFNESLYVQDELYAGTDFMIG